MSLPRNELLVTNVLDGLRTLPDESIHCVITSPPYWGLRHYEIEPQIWGGDAVCRHRWKAPVKGKKTSQWTDHKAKYSTKGNQEEINARRVHEEPQHGSFCSKCNAWKGDYGLEPTLDLYLEHTVRIFREVRRVLRSDGVLWLNLGDSYVSNSTGAKPQTGMKGRKLGDESISRSNAAGGPGLKPKDLIGLPWEVAFALRRDGWWLRSDILWEKPNPLPESVRDRPSRCHEYVFLLSKSRHYFFDLCGFREDVKPESIKRCREGFLGNDPERDGHNHYGEGFQRGEGFELESRNVRTVWDIACQPFPGAHFATFPLRLIERPILLSTSEMGACSECGTPLRRKTKRKYVKPRNHRGGFAGRKDPTPDSRRDGTRKPRLDVVHSTVGWEKPCGHEGADSKPCVVLDPFMGSGTVALVALRAGRHFVGIELSDSYAEIARKRIAPELSQNRLF